MLDTAERAESPGEMNKQRLYNWRTKKSIRKPESLVSGEKEQKVLKHNLTRNKSLITRRINQIRQLMSENCITKVSYLKESLNEMLQETIEIYEQMIELLEGALLDSEDSVRIQGVVFMLVYAIVT